MEISIRGARILWTVRDVPLLGDVNITQTTVVSWVVLGLITALCLWLGSGLKTVGISRKQAVAEMAVTALVRFVRNNMGDGFDQYIPLIGTIFITSIISNLISLVGFWSPTADLMTELGWALVVFVLITYHKIRASGLGGYFKGFLQPVFLLAPINIMAELFTPVSMACRHFGNILSGTVISALIYGALTAASYGLLNLIGNSPMAALLLVVAGAAAFLLGMRKKRKLPAVAGVVAATLGAASLFHSAGGFLGQIPWLAVGIPAVASFYFDWFGGCIQAFIFCTLTAIFIKQAAGEDTEKRINIQS